MVWLHNLYSCIFLNISYYVFFFSWFWISPCPFKNILFTIGLQHTFRTFLKCSFHFLASQEQLFHAHLTLQSVLWVLNFSVVFLMASVLIAFPQGNTQKYGGTKLCTKSTQRVTECFPSWLLFLSIEKTLFGEILRLLLLLVSNGVWQEGGVVRRS